MVMITFLVHALCSIVSCDVKMPYPEVQDDLSISESSTSPAAAAASSLFSEVLMLDAHVDTKLGGLDGYVMKTMTGKRIYAFEGIPYAEPPVGPYRFRV